MHAQTILVVNKPFTMLAEETKQLDPNAVTPGWEGFVFTAIFVLAVTVIGVLMVRKVRTINYRAEVRERLRQEQEENSQTQQGEF